MPDDTLDSTVPADDITRGEKMMALINTSKLSQPYAPAAKPDNSVRELISVHAPADNPESGIPKPNIIPTGAPEGPRRPYYYDNNLDDMPKRGRPYGRGRGRGRHRGNHRPHPTPRYNNYAPPSALRDFGTSFGAKR